MTLFDPPTVAGWGQNEYWLSTARQWAKTRWGNGLKWSAQDWGILQNLEELSPADAVTSILRFYSIFDASQSTKDAMEQLIATTLADRPWAMRSEPFAVGLFAPEVQCA